MIPAMNIVAWGRTVPWVEQRQVEQDLVMARASEHVQQKWEPVLQKDMLKQDDRSHCKARRADPPNTPTESLATIILYWRARIENCTMQSHELVGPSSIVFKAVARHFGEVRSEHAIE
jgi:hypothetical protein